MTKIATATPVEDCPAWHEFLATITNNVAELQAYLRRVVGYCLTGIIMGAAALLNRNPSPTDAHIRSELDIHLCRCGSYDRILRAIRRASQKMSKGKAL